MNRVRNADEFLLEFRRICWEYDQVYGPRLAEIRRRYTGTPEEDNIDQNLEAHVRVYFVNSLLAALNWRIDTSPENDLPNLIPETRVRSKRKGSIRFLDYLGLEREISSPLLIIETKRPSAQLPEAKDATACPEIIAQGLTGKSLPGKWNEWLEDLRDYVKPFHLHPPKRVVITSGDWLILFLNPVDAFLKDGVPDPSWIYVFQDRRDIEKLFREFFCH